MNLALNIRWIAITVPEGTLRRRKRRLRTAGLETAKLDLSHFRFYCFDWIDRPRRHFAAKEVISIPWGDAHVKRVSPLGSERPPIREVYLRVV